MNEFKLMPHQVDAVNAVSNFKKCAFYTDMGSGKTFMASYKANQLANGRLIIILCKKSAIPDWENHFKIYWPNLKIKVINYDLLVARKLHLTIDEPFILICDESSAIKNIKAKRTKYTLALCNMTDSVILLSGSPIGGKYEELLTQCHILGWKVNEDVFYNNYCIREWLEDPNCLVYDDKIKAERPRKVLTITGYKNIDHLKKRLLNNGAFFGERLSCKKMPDTYFYLDKDKMYKALDKNNYYLNKKTGEEIINDTMSKRHTNLLLACGLNENKIECFKELIENSNERIVVFYNRKLEFELLKQIVLENNRHLSYVNGDGRDLENYEKYDDTIILCQWQSGSYSLNLQKAAIMILYSYTNQPELYQQALKRIDRVNQEQTIRYYFLVVKDSREQDCVNSIQEGKLFTDILYQDDDKKSLEKTKYKKQ